MLPVGTLVPTLDTAIFPTVLSPSLVNLTCCSPFLLQAWASANMVGDKVTPLDLGGRWKLRPRDEALA